jgi:hypothetical protein
MAILGNHPIAAQCPRDFMSMRRCTVDIQAFQPEHLRKYLLGFDAQKSRRYAARREMKV